MTGTAGKDQLGSREAGQEKTGIDGDTDLIAFALANVALEDDFASAFKSAKGKITSDRKLGFKLAQFNFDAALRWARYGSRKALGAPIRQRIAVSQ